MAEYRSKYRGEEVDALLDKIAEGNVGGIDSALSLESENPVQNKVITEELNKKVNKTNIATINGQTLTNGGNIEVSTDAYDDTEIKGKLTELQSKVGELSYLETTDKTSIVNAINEVAQGSGSGVSNKFITICEMFEVTESAVLLWDKDINGNPFKCKEIIISVKNNAGTSFVSNFHLYDSVGKKYPSVLSILQSPTSGYQNNHIVAVIENGMLTYRQFTGLQNHIAATGQYVVQNIPYIKNIGIDRRMPDIAKIETASPIGVGSIISIVGVE